MDGWRGDACGTVTRRANAQTESRSCAALTARRAVEGRREPGNQSTPADRSVHPEVSRAREGGEALEDEAEDGGGTLGAMWCLVFWSANRALASQP